MTENSPRSWIPLPREFFDRPAVELAPELLGCVLRHDTTAGSVAVLLTEVEAYAGPLDPASHAYRGQTARNAVMFGPPGHAYVYFTYGMHFCVNLVCEPAGQVSAVLLRAGTVIEGTELATQRRSAAPRVGAARSSTARSSTARVAERDLARGPGRLCQALGIDRSLDGADVCAAGPLGIGTPPGWSPAPKEAISAGPRVGVSQAADLPWRFWLTGERSVSAYRRAVPRHAAAKTVTASAPGDGTMHR